MATKKIIEVDVVNSLSDGDTIFVNSDNSLKQISKSNLVIKGADGGYYTPAVDADGNLSWTASKADMPAVDGASIKGPQGVSGVYVGSGDMPDGYNVQIDPDGAPSDIIPTIDETLTEHGKAADAKATGDAINLLSEEIADLQTAMGSYINDIDTLVGGEPDGNGR